MTRRRRMAQRGISTRSTRSALGCLMALFIPGSCVGTPTAWRQVDAEHQMITVVGRLEVFDMPSEGDVRLEVAPDSDHRFALAPGQQRLVCIVHAFDRDSLTSQLLNLTVGQRVTVSGYWVARDESDGLRHYINGTADIVPHN